MNKIFFRYKKHPGDFLRDTEINEMPNPDENLESFLIWFLEHYQSDSRITYINEVSKYIDNEFFDAEELSRFETKIGNKTKNELLSETIDIEEELKIEAYKNFYHLLLSNKIEICITNEK